tara:strand:+ start:194 stop:877 length:684 start_codon:yes stop_codon:yes gene_type:complete
MRELKCVVTGASSGIGKEISIELSKYSKHIYIIARSINKLEDVHDSIIQNECECTIVPLDLTEANGIENLSSQLLKKEKAIDILMLSAGVINELSPIVSIELTKLKEILSVNFLANFRMIKCFHPLLKNSAFSKIGVISSLKNISKEQYWGIYQPIMTALNDLLLIYAKENKDIKLNIFSPEAVNTKFREIIMPGEDKSKISSPIDTAIRIVNYIIETKNSGEIINI